MALDLTFQQLQKYESGANRVSASRLWQIATILDVPVSFFFADMPGADRPQTAEEKASRERMTRPETIELIRLYWTISDPEVRRQFLNLIKATARTAESPGLPG
jgi:transcriptional regulator with XRE-family HTH domain